jgi:hypothetical protein
MPNKSQHAAALWKYYSEVQHSLFVLCTSVGLPWFGPEPWFEPEPFRTGPWSSPQLSEYTGPNHQSGLRFCLRIFFPNRFEQVQTSEPKWKCPTKPVNINKYINCNIAWTINAHAWGIPLRPMRRLFPMVQVMCLIDKPCGPCQLNRLTTMLINTDIDWINKHTLIS